ncbi:MAG: ATP-dependent zinc metalloprotease FtsH [Candidatus Borkfalkiaceae bacterium]|nr:ATP-dependent zinc metalloprotease FtsH [Christensenellaceae bacterium]
MKRSTAFILLFVCLIAVAFLIIRISGNVTQKVNTDQFWDKAGFVFVDENCELIDPAAEGNGGSQGTPTAADSEKAESSSETGKNDQTAVTEKTGADVIQAADANKKYKQYNYNGTLVNVLYDGRDRGFIIVDRGDIKRIVVNTYNLVGYAYDTKGNPYPAYKSSYSRSEVETMYLQAFMSLKTVTGNDKYSVDYGDPNSGAIWSSLILPLLTTGIGIVIIVIIMRQAQGGGKSALDFGKTKARVNSNVKVRFSDVAGAEEEKRELQEVVEFLKNPKKFSALGAKIPKGVLLVGPPGTGKTLFAKAVAGEANVPFFSISGSDFVEMFVGVGASRVRDLFAMAKKAMPCIVFIDEIDAVGRQRGAGLGGGNDEREQTLNQLLVQMDGFESNEGIIIMAATNRADILDPALMRPGRFDRQVYVHLPDVRGREAILKVHARNKPLAANVSFKILARMTAGFSGADLANLLNEAAILAARANRKAITNADLYEGIEKVLMGPQKRSQLVTESDKRITAYHESGHAILAKLMPNCDEVHEVTIIPRGQAGGYTLTRPDSDNQYMSKNKLLDELVMTMGGRAAEELIIKDYTSGASADIKQASKIARAMVTELGMSEKIGPVNYGGDDQIFVGRDYQTRTSYSEAMAKLIDEEVENLIKTAHEKAVNTLKENKDLLDRMARVLVERETIYSDEVQMLVDGASVEEVTAYMDKNEAEEKENPFRTKEKKVSADNSAEVKEKAENLADDKKAENGAEVKTETADKSDDKGEN